AGYGVMGLPFASGHILALRRFPASSVGPGYASVWHRSPQGRWTIYTSVPPLQACPRYFGNETAVAEAADIRINWAGPRSFAVTIPGGRLQWDVTLAATLATQAMNAMGRSMPDALWQSRPVLSLMAAVAGPLLGAGRLSLHGLAPNRQWFIANPRLIWSIPATRAIWHGQDLGLIGPVPDQGRLGDFWIPQRGLFAVGESFFEPFDPARHLAVATQAASETPVAR
ncbi:MAG: hypothetical protein ACRDI2_11265, partial [Chloroflexota bacterium]